MNIPKVINTANPQSDDLAKAIYALMEQAKFVLGYRFKPETWEDVKQNIMLKLYTKTIPNLSGKNNFAYVRTKVYFLLKDEVRKIAKDIERIDTLDDGLANSLFSKQEDYVGLLELCDELEDSDLTQLEQKRLKRLRKELGERLSERW